MQITEDLKNILFKIDQSNLSLITLFLFGYIAFSLFNKLTNKTSDEDNARNFRKSIKYLDKYQKENEEFFFGNLEDEPSYD